MVMDLDQAILELIEREDFRDQLRLGQSLGESGYAVTQPTLSRHLRRLNVRKLNGVYRHADVPAAILPDYRLEVVPPNLIIMRTGPGRAPLLALWLDEHQPEKVRGTIAGDDTVFLACLEGDLYSVANWIEQELRAS